MPSRGRTTKNYNKDLLLRIVDSILPSSTEAWGEVSNRYKEASGEALARDPVGIKRFFTEKCCDRMKKPTGSSAPKELVRRAQSIYLRILGNADAGVYGDSSSDSSSSSSIDSDADENEDNFFEALEGGEAAPLSASSSAVSSATPAPTTVASAGESATSSVVSSSSVSKKRRREDGDGKSKSTRNKPRANIAQSFTAIADAMKHASARHEENGMMQMMLTMMQQQQQQQQQYQQMMMMMMMGGRAQGPPGMPISTPWAPPSNNESAASNNNVNGFDSNGPLNFE